MGELISEANDGVATEKQKVVAHFNRVCSKVMEVKASKQKGAVEICSVLLKNAEENIDEEIVGLRLSSRLILVLEELNWKKMTLEKAKKNNEKVRSEIRKSS